MRFEPGRLVVHRDFVDDRLVFVRTARVVEHDERGLRLIHDWIRQLPRTKEERSLMAKLYNLDESTVAAREKTTAEIETRRKALAIAKTNNRTTPNTEDRKQAEVNVKNRAQEAAKQRTAERD